MKPRIFFGPSSIGSSKDAINNLNLYKKNNLSACEIAFTYGIYIGKEEAKIIKKEAEKLGFILSIHAPYYINLNSEDEKKVKNSVKRIVDCCEIGHYLGARRVIFHSGFYGKFSKEQTFNNIKKRIEEIIMINKRNKWDIEICPEVMGKINVFGSIEEISKLANETGCSFCIDFAHILARYKENKFELIEKSFPQKKWHCHFSGIVYGEKGEKHHIKTKKEEWKELFSFLKKLDKEIVIINESPDHINDAIEGASLWIKD